MTTEMQFPNLDAFAFSVSHGEVLTHTYENVSLLVLEKEAQIILRNRIYALNRGDALLALPYSYMREKAASSPFYGYEIRFPLNALRTLAPALYFRVADGGAALSFSKVSANRLIDLCSALSDKASTVCTVAQLFSLLEQEALPTEETALALPLPKLLRRALARLSENGTEDVDVSSLAKRYSTSESTLRRLFSTYLATTPMKYAKELQKLREARYKKNEVE